MNIKLLEGQNVNLSKIQKDLKLGSRTLYRYANGERKIQNMPLRLAARVSDYLGISINEFYYGMLEYKHNQIIKERKERVII